MSEVTDKLNQIHNEYKDNFRGTFHSVLWEIMVNGNRADKMSAFVPTQEGSGYDLSIADQGEKGYSKTPAFFETEHWEEATAICIRLTEAVWGHNAKTRSLIIMDTMNAF